MILELPYGKLVNLVLKQLDNLFIFEQDKEQHPLNEGVELALSRVEQCFLSTDNKYYKKNGEVYFSPFHSGQYSIFLYFLSNSIYRLFPESIVLADKIYYLNKALNGLDLFYAVEMPKVFFLDHPVGSVIGRAVLGEFFSFSQNCTVGNNHGVYPEIGERVTMLSGSKVIGNSKIGNNVIISANSYLKDVDIPGNSIVFGQSPDLVIKVNKTGNILNK
ncbi:MAG: hypothetical protein KAJ63_07095 [Methyloprofundus sp.]|nr:hypothetical protein [Methyloprofundus sp.]